MKTNFNLTRVSVTKSLLSDAIYAVIELQNELYESSKACWDDDRHSLQKRITELKHIEARLCKAMSKGNIL